MRPLCQCGQRAQLSKSKKGYMIKCLYCDKRSDHQASAEEARKDWVAKRKLRRWY